MSFLIRASLAIGLLSWFALQRQGAPVPNLPDRTALADATGAWDALPAPARALLLRESAAEIARRGSAAESRDTLLDSDRTAPWHGAQARADAGRPAERGERSAP